MKLFLKFFKLSNLYSYFLVLSLLNIFFSTANANNKIFKIDDIEIKLSSDNLDPTDTLNFSNQKESLKIQTNKLREEIENIESENFDEIDILEKDKENLEEVKKQLVVVAKLVKSEWDLVDQQMPILENEKSKFISTFPDELKVFYDNLKNKGVEIIAAYKIGNQCGCCGVELTTSEIDKILSTKFQQCTYCDGVLV